MGGELTMPPEFSIHSESEGRPVLWQTAGRTLTHFILRWTEVYATSLNTARAIQREYINDNGTPDLRR